ncbi:MAG TPA: peptide-methionine (S)-S-oxide reductase [Pseudoalteromonas prydzensis]|uniref:Peptide methionine sulfoxide reductase MsrA n=1 Tax=Pseudoalteromonas prydzensis TaxID=182141 RepID=A0A7V1GEM6_9GAMM|nr:peptide-methionine (S)-S-oxide reductase MsrA [Pseudoalteromonas prydzensis]HEA16674.1 peptide-methionine (S)-S-oxide reductase [Pseudoalteromonas prydzensis]
MTSKNWLTLATCSVLFSAASYALSFENETDGDVQATMHLETIVLGSGCFWGAEKRYEALAGVIDAESGYADGKGFKASYRNITKQSRRYDENNYAEVVQVTFNSNIISAETLLKNYFESHDPTQKNRQGNDIGTQYRSIVLTTTAEQAKLVEQLKAQYQSKLTAAGFGTIKTIVKPLTEFFPAEEYHQDYLVKNPNGYCPDHSTGVVFEKVTEDAIDNTALLAGKQIVVIDSRDYCPYCEKFKKDVSNEYKGSIALTYRKADQLDGLTIKTPTWATPTILFLEDGKEVYGRQGYVSAAEFYKALGAFKLGDSEAYSVAFNARTDSPFCKQYAIFKNTPDGIFIDKLSGVPLFDTRDRFKSGTGWLSFTHPVKDTVTLHDDNSYGMQRIEIKSKSSGIHLGHLFPGEGPKGQDRYCINATVLEFVAREQS